MNNASVAQNSLQRYACLQIVVAERPLSKGKVGGSTPSWGFPHTSFAVKEPK